MEEYLFFVFYVFFSGNFLFSWFAFASFQ